jgi:hypothetical protein
MKEFKADREEVKITKELLTFCQCAHPTLVSWIRDWLVDNKPLGRKVGGRWLVNVVQLNKFMKGQGRPNPKARQYKPQSVPQNRGKGKGCKFYDECLDTASRFNSNMPCGSCDKYEKT